MGISTSASPGIEVETAAKESSGAAATLGSQTAAAADEVIVPDAITANNEGNLASTPTYVGRLFSLRPWEVRLDIGGVETANIVITSGGTGYAVDDVLTLAPTSGLAAGVGFPQLTVTAVSSGVITDFIVSRAAGWTWQGQYMNNFPSPTAPTASPVTGGTGSSATFDLTDALWEAHWEFRYITDDASNTLTVHEAWEIPPVSGDDWAVSYIMADVATVTGCTLRAQSGVYECTRPLIVGFDTDTGTTATITDIGFLWIGDGTQVEIPDDFPFDFKIAGCGCFVSGYLAGGTPVAGGYLSSGGTGANDIYTYWGMYFLYDFNIRLPRERLDWLSLASAGGPNDDMAPGLVSIYKQFGREVRRNKNFDIFNTQWIGAKVRDCVMSTGIWRIMTIEAEEYQLGGQGFSTSVKLIPYDVQNVTIHNGYGFSTGTTNSGTFPMLTGPLDSGYGIRKVTFAQSAYVYVRGAGSTQVQNWRLVDPQYSKPDLTGVARGTFIWTDATGEGTVSVYMSYIARCVDVSGVRLEGVRGYIYESAFGDALLTDNSESSASQLINRAFNDVHAFLDEVYNEIAYHSDVLTNIYSNGTGVTVLEERRGAFAWKAYFYGYSPVVSPFVLDLNGILTQATFQEDGFLTAATAAAALTNPTSAPVVTKHGPGETDTRPMKALNYDAGTGSVPTIGETVTQGSATGVVLDYEGSAVSGTLLVESWNGTEFTDNQTITGGTSSFSATTNLVGGTSFYEEYTWEVDANSEAMTIVYDYLAASMAADAPSAIFEEVIRWGATEIQAAQLMYNSGAAWYTPRSRRPADARANTDYTSEFTDNFNRANEDLDASSNWEVVGAVDNPMRVDTNQIRGGATASAVSVMGVAVATENFEEDQYATVTVATLSATADSEFGLACRILDTGGAQPQMVRAVLLNTTTDVYQIWQDYPDGQTDLIAEGTSTPAATDVMELFVIGNLAVLVIDGTIECSGGLTQQMALGGQPGLYGFTSSATDAARLDDFEAANAGIGESAILGEGVWIHTRGTGDIDYFTSDSGVQFTPVAQVTITTDGVTRGTSVVVQAKETSGTVTDGDILDQGFADVNGEVSFTVIYETAWNPDGLNVEVRARNQGIAVAVLQDDGGAFTDYTAAANTGATAGDVFPLPASAALNDAMYLGHTDADWAGMKIYLTTAHAGTWDVTWEYWNGATWASLTTTRDDDWSTGTGDKVTQWTVPGDWATTTVNSIAGLYWVRMRASGSFSQSTQAVARKVTLDATRYLPDVQRRAITSSGLVTTMSWNEDAISEFP